MKEITIRKIAELAGTSRGAVDKVIHGRPGVKEPVRREILRVIEETGYRPIHAAPAADGRKKTVAVILPRLVNSYFVALKRGMDELSEPMRSIALEYYFCDSTDIEGMLAILDFLDERPVDAYMIRGVRSKRLLARLNALQTPVIFIDSDVPGARRLCLVGEECYKSGRVAASLLAKSIGYAGEAAVIGGSTEITGHKRRLEGFHDAIRERYPAVKIVDQVYSEEQSVIAYERACKLLDRHPGLRGICNLAGYAGEVGQAIIDRGRQKKVKMVCYNTTSDVAALIRKGIVEFSISLAPYRQGQILMETAYAYLEQGKLPPADFIKTPISIALDENIDMLFEEEQEL